MSKRNELLLDDNDLLVIQTKLAIAIGDRQAIALQQIHYWNDINRKAVKSTHFFDDKWWAFNTWGDWKKNNFPFWSVSTIRRIFQDLHKNNIIHLKAHDERNKGVWVAVNYEGLDLFLKKGSAQNEQTGLLKMNRPSIQNEQTLNNTENTTDTKSESFSPNGKNGTIPASQMNPMKDALAKAFSWDWQRMTKGEKGLIQVTAKELCAAGYTSDDIPSMHKYCTERFTNISPRALATHASEWRVSHTAPPKKQIIEVVPVTPILRIKE